VLPPNALDRCANEDDWVRLEVCRAMTNKKNILPVMLNGFTWPNLMPNGMEELCDYQALTATSTEYFDMAMERLQQRYLKSKSHLFLRRWVQYLMAVVVFFIDYHFYCMGCFVLPFNGCLYKVCYLSYKRC
jgi:hypothetical protein